MLPRNYYLIKHICTEARMYFQADRSLLRVQLSRKVCTLQQKEKTLCTFSRQVIPHLCRDSCKYLITLPDLKETFLE